MWVRTLGVLEVNPDWDSIWDDPWRTGSSSKVRPLGPRLAKGCVSALYFLLSDFKRGDFKRFLFFRRFQALLSRKLKIKIESNSCTKIAKKINEIHTSSYVWYLQLFFVFPIARSLLLFMSDVGSAKCSLFSE